MKKGFMDPRKPIVGTVTTWAPLGLLLLVILVSVVVVMLFNGRISTREQELEARLLDKAKAVELQEQRLKRFKSELRNQMSGQSAKQKAEKAAGEAAAVETEDAEEQ